METLALVLTAVSCTAAATWLIRSAIAGVAEALKAHVAEDEAYHAKIIQLEKRRARR